MGAHCPRAPGFSVPFGSGLSSHPHPSLSSLTTNIAELVFSSEQEQKSFEFFIRDLLPPACAKLRARASAVRYLYFSLVTDGLFLQSSCPCSREAWASHAVLKLAFSGSHVGREGIEIPDGLGSHGGMEETEGEMGGRGSVEH